MEVFFTLIFAVIFVGIVGTLYEFLHETRVLDNSYLIFKVHLPTSDSDTTQITGGGPKVPIEGIVHLDAP